MRTSTCRAALPLLLLLGCGDDAAQSQNNGGSGFGGGDGGTSPALSQCGDSVCPLDYPCEMQSASYTCRGQFADWTPEDSPTTLSDNGDGTVSDAKSGLVWQQSVDEESFSWADAGNYCASVMLAGTGWRLPTKAELESIVDLGTSSPSIDQAIFPGTPPDVFWSSSPYAGAADNAWFVYFDKGYTYYRETSVLYRVRCVR